MSALPLNPLILIVPIVFGTIGLYGALVLVQEMLKSGKKES